jgi:hypothetical protein
VEPDNLAHEHVPVWLVPVCRPGNELALPNLCVVSREAEEVEHRGALLDPQRPQRLLVSVERHEVRHLVANSGGIKKASSKARFPTSSG